MALSVPLIVAAATVKIAIPAFELDQAPQVLALRLPDYYSAAIDASQCATTLPAAKFSQDATDALNACDQNTACVAGIGRMLGVDFVLVGDFTKTTDQFDTHLSLVNVRTRAVVKQLESHYIGGLKDLGASVRELVPLLCKAVDPRWEDPTVRRAEESLEDLAFDTEGLPPAPKGQPEAKKPPAPVMLALAVPKSAPPPPTPSPPAQAPKPAPALAVASKPAPTAPVTPVAKPVVAAVIPKPAPAAIPPPKPAPATAVRTPKSAPIAAKPATPARKPVVTVATAAPPPGAEPKPVAPPPAKPIVAAVAPPRKPTVAAVPDKPKPVAAVAEASKPLLPLAEPRENIEPRRLLNIVPMPASSRARTISYALMGSAGAAALIAGGTGYGALAAAKTRLGATDLASYNAAQSSAVTRGAVSNISFGLAGAAAITSLVIWFAGDHFFHDNPVIRQAALP